MKDAKGHGSDQRGAAHQDGVRSATDSLIRERPPSLTDSLIRYNQERADYYLEQMGRFGRASDMRHYERHDRAVRQLMSGMK